MLIKTNHLEIEAVAEEEVADSEEEKQNRQNRSNTIKNRVRKAIATTSKQANVIGLIADSLIALNLSS
jgi:hypothetical protein